MKRIILVALLAFGLTFLPGAAVGRIRAQRPA
jgi:hypothetical protein